MSAWKPILGVVVILLAVRFAMADDPNSDKPSLAPVDVASSPTIRPVTNPTLTSGHHSDPATISVQKAGKTPTVADPVVNVGKVEKVVDRYPDGKVRIEREMGLDSSGNYINQGSYKMYDPDGQIVREGDFMNGKLQGKWMRRFDKDDGHLFSPSADDEYTGPFLSEATFLDGQLHGVWTIKDAAGNKIVEWNFDKGARTGAWTWWHSNGKKRLEANFRESLEWRRCRVRS